MVEQSANVEAYLCEPRLTCPRCQHAMESQVVLDRHLERGKCIPKTSFKKPSFEQNNEDESHQAASFSTPVNDTSIPVVENRSSLAEVKRSTDSEGVTQFFLTFSTEFYQKLFLKGEAVYTCSTCRQTCETKTAAKSHANVCALTQCYFCKKFFTKSSLFKVKQHYAEHAASLLGQKPSPSREEEEPSPTKREVKNNDHQASSSEDGDVLDGHTCRVCQQCFPSRMRLRKHVCPQWWRVLPKPTFRMTTPFQCSTCGRDFSRYVDLQNHKNVHRNEDRHPCPLCGKPFTERAALDQHQLEVHTEDSAKAFQCIFCQVEFGTKYQLEVHLRLHQGQTPYLCPHCPRSFHRSDLLQKHLKAHRVDQPHTCHFCGGVYRKKIYLYQHLQRRHPEKTRHQCNLCKKTFADSTDLKRHLRIHSNQRPFQCNVCHKRFRQKGQLKVHLRSHTRDKPYVCDQCNKPFRQGAHLTRHLRVHSGYKPYKCPSCYKAFASTGSLKEHQLTHTNQRPYKCEQCNNGFISSSALKIHRQRHLEDKPYSCHTCTKTFKTSSDVKRHQQTMHPEVEEMIEFFKQTRGSFF
ncbi:zinc finger protein 883-like [Montipora capricornis]|uniref:zinc finger protein 883-like n=1 Tax=Montipora capricornis TaxID=246305 RepID=UPI0035F1CE56